MSGLYVHVPFCEQHCHYCTFPIAVLPASEHSAYVDRVCRELELAGVEGRFETVYLGGGTPSLLRGELIGRLIGRFADHAREVTIEANPGTLSDDGVRAFLDHGVNRVSLGAQSFDSADLVAAGRLHSPQDTRRDVERLRRLGIENLSLDLIAGLAGQQPQAWSRSLESLLQLDPDHVSIYMIELEDSAIWARRRARDPGSFDFPDDDRLASFAAEADDRLTEAGYRHYEISSWARPGRECRHNIGYWNGSEYCGAGLGAHSLMGGERFWNTRSFSHYARSIDGGELPIAGTERWTPRMRLEEAFLVGLRQLDGIDIRTLSADLGFAYPEAWFGRVHDLEEAGIVEFPDPILKLTRRGWLVASGVAEELVWPDLLSTSEVIP